MGMNWKPVEDDGLPPVGAWLVYLEKPLFQMRTHTVRVGMSGNDMKICFVAGHFHFEAPTMTYYREIPEGPE